MLETTSRSASKEEKQKRSSEEANLIEERTKLLDKINNSFKRKIARANKKYEQEESTTSEEEFSDGENSKQGRRRAKMVSFNSRIPRKKDTLNQENAAYNKAVKRVLKGTMILTCFQTQTAQKLNDMKKENINTWIN